MRTLQHIVERTSDALHQPVLMDDASLRPLAYSAHRQGQADEVRIDCILEREVRPEVSRWLQDVGITEAEEPMRILGGEAVGLTPRWCAPIRHQGTLLGFLWVIAGEEPAAGELAQLAGFADDAARAIERERGSGRRQAAPHEALRQLVCSAPSESYAAAARLVGSGVVRLEQQVLVLVVGVGRGEMTATSRVAAGIGTQQFAASSGCRALHTVLDDQAVCLVPSDDAAGLRRRAPELGALLHGCMTQAWAGRHTPTIGIGTVVGSLAETRTSYERALWAAHVAGRLPETGPIAAWDDLGVFQLLRRVDAGDALPSGLQALISRPNASMLLETLEAYLDTGGDAQATAARLFLARGSLYYRLRRIEEMADVDLSDGGVRLALHLGLKLVRLSGGWSSVEHDGLRLAV